MAQFSYDILNAAPTLIGHSEFCELVVAFLCDTLLQSDISKAQHPKGDFEPRSIQNAAKASVVRKLARAVQRIKRTSRRAGEYRQQRHINA